MIINIMIMLFVIPFVYSCYSEKAEWGFLIDEAVVFLFFWTLDFGFLMGVCYAYKFLD